MKIRAFGLTDVGKVRDHNEDCFLVNEEDRLFVVADGMGGHAAGEVASRIAVDVIENFMEGMKEEATWPYETDARISTEGNKIAQAVRMANRKVMEATRQNAHYRGMGTTLVSLRVYPDGAGGERACVGHVGDSRAYRLRNGKIEQITSDHSWINAQVQSGAISEEAAQRHPLRNVITRALGSEDDVDVDVIECEVKPGDSFLLCSDGLNTMVAEAKIGETLAAHRKDPKVACEHLIRLANERGGEDNITVVIVSADE